MLNIHRILLIVVAMVFSLNTFAEKEQKRILALYSYDATFNTYKQSIDDLHNEFPEKDYMVDVEFLDSKRYANGELNQTVYNRIKIKQQNQNKYDIVISGDDNALQFCIKYQNELFFETPIVFWGINDLELGFSQNNNPWITGVTDDIGIEKNLQLILKLHPNQKDLVVLNDNTTTGIANDKAFDILLKDFPEFNVEKILSSDYTLNEFEDLLQALGPKKIILVISAMRTKNKYLGMEEINTVLKRVSGKIIYNNYLYQQGYGFAGGRVINFYHQTANALLYAKQILNGTPVGQINVSKINPPNELVVDFRRMKELGIDLSNLKGEAEVINLPAREVKIGKRILFITGGILIVFLLLIFHYIIDLRNKNKLEKSLRMNAENYSSIFKENHSIMLIIEPKTGQIMDANKAACKFYGYTPTEFKKLNASQIDTLPKIDLQQVLKGILQKNTQVQVKHKLKNGEIKDVEVHAGRIEINMQTYLYAIVHDISKRMLQQKELIDARKKAEESDHLKSAFLANMSHEIRTPMNSILGFSSLIADDDIDPKTRKQYVDFIQTNGEHLLNLINDIIDLSKIEANKLNIKINDCKLNTLLDEVYNISKGQLDTFPSKKITLLLDKDIKNPDFNIKTDEVRLKQILLNLLSNAMKFTDSGQIEFGYKFRDDSMIQFYVKDTGIGIPADKIDSVFSPFEQVEDIASRSHGGSGLGLSITKSLVENLGGHIWLMSELGKGSRFYFTISATTNLLNLN